MFTTIRLTTVSIDCGAVTSRDGKHDIFLQLCTLSAWAYFRGRRGRKYIIYCSCIFQLSIYKLICIWRNTISSETTATHVHRLPVRVAFLDLLLIIKQVPFQVYILTQTHNSVRLFPAKKDSQHFPFLLINSTQIWNYDTWGMSVGNKTVSFSPCSNVIIIIIIIMRTNTYWVRCECSCNVSSC